MSGAPSLETFLTGAKTHLQTVIKNREKVTLVIGDEHADLDSVVSSILFSYLRTASPPSGAWTEVYTPLINASRNEIGARNILAKLLPEVGLKNQHLITVEDLVHHGSTKSGLLAENTKFFLLDHNIMLGRKDQNYSDNVLGCIDHHRDENYVPTNTDPEPRIIGQSGSCTSLVVNWGAKEWSYLEGSGNETSQLQLAKLALAPILLDTENLSSSSATQEDSQAVEFLEGKIRASEGSSGQYDRTAFYNLLIGGGASQSTGTTTTQTSTTGTGVNTGGAATRTEIGSTGFYDPFATEKTTGPTGFATGFTGDVGTTQGGSTTEYTSGDNLGTSTTGYTTEDTSTTNQTSSSSGGGILSSAYNYLTGGGNKSTTEADDVTTQDATTGGDYTTTTTAGTSGTSGTSGAYDPYAKEATTGATGFATRFEGDTDTAGTTTTSDTTYDQPQTTSTTGTTGGAGGFLSSRLPWFSSSTTTTTETSEPTTTSGSGYTSGEYTTGAGTGEATGEVLPGRANISEIVQEQLHETQ